MANNELRALPAGGRDPTRDEEGDPLPNEAGEWEVRCEREDEFTVSNGLRIYRTEYLGNAERLAGWLNRAALPAGGRDPETPASWVRALEVAKVAIEEAITSEDGLDGARGEAVLAQINEALASRVVRYLLSALRGAPAGGDPTWRQGEPDLEYGYTKLREALFECAKLGVLLDSIVGRDIAQIAYSALTDYPALEIIVHPESDEGLARIQEIGKEAALAPRMPEPTQVTPDSVYLKGTLVERIRGAL
jgi:hypothetical protein